MKIIYEVKNQFESCKIYQIDENSYDIHERLKIYYGKIILNEVNYDKSQNQNEE